MGARSALEYIWSCHLVGGVAEGVGEGAGVVSTTQQEPSAFLPAGQAAEAGTAMMRIRLNAVASFLAVRNGCLIAVSPDLSGVNNDVS
jgi:hypothetical protein